MSNRSETKISNPVFSQCTWVQGKRKQNIDWQFLGIIVLLCTPHHDVILRQSQWSSTRQMHVTGRRAGMTESLLPPYLSIYSTLHFRCGRPCGSGCSGMCNLFILAVRGSALVMITSKCVCVFLCVLWLCFPNCANQWITRPSLRR